MKKEALHPLVYKGIAHRGLHDATTMENSLGAFAKAVEAGMAIELDIHLTKDKRLVVCHDSSLLRVTGREGRIEDLTLEEIQGGYRLLDGQKIPSFEEVLRLVDERVPIVVELKATNKTCFAVGRAACRALAGKDPKNFCFISFDPRAILVPGRFPRGLLVCKERQDMFMFRSLFEFLDVEDCLVEDPRVVSFRKRGLVNVWTIREEQNLQRVLPYVDMVTFEHLSPSLVKETLKDR